MGRALDSGNLNDFWFGQRILACGRKNHSLLKRGQKSANADRSCVVIQSLYNAVPWLGGINHVIFVRSVLFNAFFYIQLIVLMVGGSPCLIF